MVRQEYWKQLKYCRVGGPGDCGLGMRHGYSEAGPVLQDGWTGGVLLYEAEDVHGSSSSAAEWVDWGTYSMGRQRYREAAPVLHGASARVLMLRGTTEV